jgi:hypothetical protein
MGRRRDKIYSVAPFHPSISNAGDIRGKKTGKKGGGREIGLGVEGGHRIIHVYYRHHFGGQSCLSTSDINASCTFMD